MADKAASRKPESIVEAEEFGTTCSAKPVVEDSQDAPPSEEAASLLDVTVSSSPPEKSASSEGALRDPDAPSTVQRLRQREDESVGGYLEFEDLSLWYASHLGPQYAGKDENQDAAFAITQDSCVFFAVADGVSTSFGARFAAAVAAKQFCTYLANAAADASALTSDTLVRAVFATQEELDHCLARVLANPDAGEWNEVRGASSLAMDVIRRLAENTLRPKNRFWGPVMATTLIGGYVRRSGRDHEVQLIRIGDGVAETIDREGSIASVLAMDQDETQVSSVLRPGPSGRSALNDPDLKSLTLRGGESLFISSDGLSRGYHGLIAGALQRVTGTKLLELRPGGAAGLQLLRSAAEFADSAFQGDSSLKLFADNLSMIVLSARPG